MEYITLGTGECDRYQQKQIHLLIVWNKQIFFETSTTLQCLLRVAFLLVHQWRSAANCFFICTVPVPFGPSFSFATLPGRVETRVTFAESLSGWVSSQPLHHCSPELVNFLISHHFPRIRPECIFLNCFIFHTYFFINRWNTQKIKGRYEYI